MQTVQQERILVVEDDPSMSRILKTCLEAAGYQVHLAGDGAKAMAHLSASDVDLVLLDVRLPDCSGYEVCRKIRQKFQPWAPHILMLTGLDQPVDQLRGYAFGADAYLTKPCELQELRKTIAQLLAARTTS